MYIKRTKQNIENYEKYLDFEVFQNKINQNLV